MFIFLQMHSNKPSVVSYHPSMQFMSCLSPGSQAVSDIYSGSDRVCSRDADTTDHGSCDSVLLYSVTYQERD